MLAKGKVLFSFPVVKLAKKYHNCLKNAIFSLGVMG